MYTVNFGILTVGDSKIGNIRRHVNPISAVEMVLRQRGLQVEGRCQNFKSGSRVPILRVSVSVIMFSDNFLQYPFKMSFKIYIFKSTCLIITYIHMNNFSGP
jgi:hypothetical protein